MLDLKELERKLDESLDLETKESLTAWLLAKRESCYKNFLGGGELIKFEMNECSFSLDPQVVNTYSDHNIQGNQDYLSEAA